MYHTSKCHNILTLRVPSTCITQHIYALYLQLFLNYEVQYHKFLQYSNNMYKNKNDLLVVGLEEGLLAATAAKLPVVGIDNTGDGLSRDEDLLGVLLIKLGLLFGVEIVLFPLEFNIELLLLFIVVLEALTAVGLIG